MAGSPLPSVEDSTAFPPSTSPREHRLTVIAACGVDGFVDMSLIGDVYFAGDTGFGEHFRRHRQTLPAPTAWHCLPIGAYQPEWFMGPIHMNPEEAVESAQRSLAPAQPVAIHFGTFSLADDGETEATDRLHQVLLFAGNGNPFWILSNGEGRNLPATDRVS